MTPSPLPKIRLDQLLVDLGHASSKASAQRLVEAGLVRTGDKVMAKPGTPVDPETPLTVTGQAHPFVSRGGLKLQAALDQWPIDVTGLVALDVGASTGGFTDCLLQHGAARVFAVDVGRDQLAPSLRADPRVTSLEGVNARTLTADQITQPPQLIVCDASFISLKLVLPAALALAAPAAALVALIKPQFEVGRDGLGKNGVVKDPARHAQVCADIQAWLTGLGWQVQGLIDSPLTGPAGNIEFLIYARHGSSATVAHG